MHTKNSAAFSDDKKMKVSMNAHESDSEESKDFDELLHSLCSFELIDSIAFVKYHEASIRDMLEELDCSPKEFIEFLSSEKCTRRVDLTNILAKDFFNYCHSLKLVDIDEVFLSIEKEFENWRKEKIEVELEHNKEDFYDFCDRLRFVGKFRISQDEIEEIAYPNASINTKDKSYKLHADRVSSENRSQVFLTSTQMKAILDAISTHEMFRSQTEELTKIKETLKETLDGLGEVYIEKTNKSKKSR